MKFEKKLIILSGEYNGKGTLSIERNAYGDFATLNLHNLTDLKSGEYCVGIKNSSICYTRQLGGLGRILLRFQIELPSFDDVHCVIFDTLSLTPVMYGTNAKDKLWSGNMMDGLDKRFKAKASSANQVSGGTQITYSARKHNINDYFLDIEPHLNSDTDKKVVENKPVKAVENTIKEVEHEAKGSFDNDVDNANDKVAQSKSDSVTAKISPFLKGATYDDGAIAQVNYFDPKSEANTESDRDDSIQQNLQNDAIINVFDQQHSEYAPETRQNEFQTSIMDMAYSAQKSIDESLARMERIENRFKTHPHKSTAKSTIQSLVQNCAGVDSNGEHEKRISTDNKFIESSNPQNNNRPHPQNPNQNNQLHQQNQPQIKFNKPYDTVSQKPFFQSVAGLDKQKKKSLRNEDNCFEGSDKIKANALDDVAFTVAPPQNYVVNSSQNYIPSKIFYEQIATQLDELFATCERAKDLEELMQDTKWVKIDFDSQGKFYVVGVIGSPAQYICYGVPATYTPAPPTQLGSGSRWLPLKAEKPEDKGYWLMFQDAISGETIE